VEVYLRRNISRVIISLEKENGMILDKHVIEDVNGEWKEYDFNLSIPQGSINVGERIRFAITSDVPGWFEVDHASLMPADNIYGFDPDVIRFMKEAGITLIRWPGGNFASQYHWKDGIGPMVCRPTRLNMAWNIPEFNYVGTDEFMKFAELVGAEPLLAVNAGWNGTVEEATEWVEYVNGNPNTTKWGAIRAQNGHTKPYNVTWWELGNELYGSWQIGHMTASEYAERYMELYKAMKAVDPKIHLIANGGLDNAAQDHYSSWLPWDDPLLSANPGKVEYLSRHYLIWVDMTESDYYKAIGWTYAIRERWKEMREILKNYQSPIPKLAITEAQGARDLDVSTTMIEAMWVAGLYNSAIYSDGFVGIITRSALIEYGGGLRKEFEVVYPTPAFYVHKIYATQPGRYPVFVRIVSPTFSAGARPPEIPLSTDNPYVDAVALFNENKTTLSILLVNYHHEKAINVNLAIHNYKIDEKTKVVRLAGKDIASRNTWRNPDNIKPVEYYMDVKQSSIELDLPPLSITLLLINGSIIPGPAPNPYEISIPMPTQTMSTITPALTTTYTHLATITQTVTYVITQTSIERVIDWQMILVPVTISLVVGMIIGWYIKRR